MGREPEKLTVYPVFSGIELYYNDMHMAYCNKEQKTVYWDCPVFLLIKIEKQGSFLWREGER